MNRQKTREQHKEDRLVELDKDFQNFQFAVQKKIGQYKTM